MAKIELYIENLQDKIDITEDIDALIKEAVSATIKFENFDYDVDVSVSYVDNEQIKKINLEHRGKNSPTDVLSFPMLEFDEDGSMIDSDYDINPDNSALMIGDIVLSVEQANIQAKEYGHSFEREVGFLTIHSALHLLGYDHEISEQEEKIMFDKQKQILQILNLTR